MDAVAADVGRDRGEGVPDGRRGEIGDRAVAGDKLGHDLLDPGAPLERQLDLDGDLAPVDDDEPVGPVSLGAPFGGGELAVQLALADPHGAGMPVEDVEAHVCDGGDVREHPGVGAPHGVVDAGREWPRRDSHTNTGSPTSIARPLAQPARSHRERSQRAACDEQPIIRASCGSVTAYCSPTTRSNSRSRGEHLIVPASARRARAGRFAGAGVGSNSCLATEEARGPDLAPRSPRETPVRRAPG